MTNLLSLPFKAKLKIKNACNEIKYRYDIDSIKIVVNPGRSKLSYDYRVSKYQVIYKNQEDGLKICRAEGCVIEEKEALLGVCQDFDY